MSETYIPVALRREVIERAHHCCEYCGIPAGATLAPHEPDHVIGEQHGGTTTLDNLALACYRCNRFKGPNIATRDDESGAVIPLFNPRTDRWSDHFQLDGAVILPLTGSGRGTVQLLRLNDEQRVALRAAMLQQNRYSPPTN